MAEILTYRQLLLFAWTEFKDSKFTSADLSRRLILWAKNFDSLGLLTRRLSTKLISNGLRRLKAWELVDRERTPMEVVTKTGKRGHRGLQYRYWIVPKGLRYVLKGKISPFGTGLAEVLERLYAKRIIPQENLVQADSLGLLPTSLQGIGRPNRRLPNRVTYGRQAMETEKIAWGLIENEKEGIAESLKNLFEYEEEKKQYEATRMVIQNVIESLEEDRERRAKETEKLKAENEAEKRKMAEGFLRSLQKLAEVSPEARKLLTEFYDEKKSDAMGSS